MAGFMRKGTIKKTNEENAEESKVAETAVAAAVVTAAAEESKDDSTNVVADAAETIAVVEAVKEVAAVAEDPCKCPSIDAPCGVLRYELGLVKENAELE